MAWMQEFERAPRIEELDERVRIGGVRDFSWSGARVTPRYITRTLESADLTGVLLVTEHFHRWGVAHVFACFRTGLDPICVSIDARREEGSRFSLLKGEFGSYEMFYTIGTARDLFEQRLDTKDRQLDVCELELSAQERWRFFFDLCRAAQKNAAEPARFRTIGRNGMTELVRALPLPVKAPLRPKDLQRRLVKRGFAKNCRSYDKTDRPPFL